MKKTVSFLLVILLIIIGVSFAQKNTFVDYKFHWNKVDSLAANQLPESAIKEVDIILKKAQADKNIAEAIKALVHKMRFTLDRDPDKATELIIKFESFTESCKNPVDKSLLQSMTAELYTKYYFYNSQTINQRTNIEGYIPKDMNEWSKNIYFSKIAQLLSFSLKNEASLKRTNSDLYENLLLNGIDSRTIQPTMFDFLTIRKIEILSSLLPYIDTEKPITNNTDSVAISDNYDPSNFKNQLIFTYNKLYQFRLEQNNIPALLYVKLQFLKFQREQNSIIFNNATYLEELDKLEKKYLENENVIEIMALKAEYYVENNDIESAKNIAYNICNKGIKLFPNYKRIDLLKNILNSITAPSLDVNFKTIANSNSTLPLTISSKNINNIDIKVFKVNASSIEYLRFKQNANQNNLIYPTRALQYTKDFNIKSTKNFELQDTTISIKTFDYGIYEFSISEKNNTNTNEVANGYFIVSDLGFISRSTEQEQQSLYILNNESGIQQEKVSVKVYEPKWNGNNYDFIGILESKTDKNGFCNLKFNNNYSERKILLEKGADKYFYSSNSAYFHKEYKSQKKESAVLNLFTDRKLYRPSQIVYFKGISYYSNSERKEVNNGASYEVELYDANNKVVSSKKFNTNDFGSFAGEFVLPANGLNGNYTIRSGRFSETIWVEEYKRPTFEVKIEKPKTEIRFGEQITLTGNAQSLAGFNVINARVEYRISRSSHRYCWWIFEPEKTMISGTTKTDSKGNFNIDFSAIKTELKADLGRGQFYSYTVYANVTDQNGETQQGENSFSVGDKSLFIITDIKDKFEKSESQKFEIFTETLNGEKIESEINYEIFELKNTDQYAEKISGDSVFINDKIITKGVFNTKNKLVLNTNKWKSGRYRIYLNSKDNRGNKVTTEKVFIIYEVNDCRPPVKTYAWLLTPKIQCKVGEKAIIKFGTSTKNTPVLVEIMQGNKILSSKWIKFNNNIKTFKVEFKESYGAGISVQFTFMKDNELYSEQVKVTRIVNSQSITPTLSIFRDKLKPGEKAEWTITIPEIKNNNKTAELLVDMYDASLDAIRPHSWYFNPVYNDAVAFSPTWSANTLIREYANIAYQTKYTEVDNFNFNRLNWFGLEFVSQYKNTQIRLRGISSYKSNSELMVVEEDGIKLPNSSIAPPPPPEVLNELTIVSTETKIQVRQNFNETAFFYPQLKTDSTGSVKLSFTCPESLTRWNVKMLAHTKDLYFGQNNAQVISQKELMVQMNLPRFVRRSDKLVLSANVINLTDKDLTAKVKFEIINPETEENISDENLQVKTVNLKANETTTVSWELSELKLQDLVICKVVAQAGNFSDGEQKYLPVLADEILVTESMPMTIRANQTRVFNFESLEKNAANVETKNLTIEFSPNPAWYAIQALPTVSSPQNNNAIDYFTAFYANTLASFIANSNPKIKTIFNQWKNTEGSKNALLSNLEKNSELKNMLLTETPWLMAAKNETEQKRQIALLFELNTQSNQSQQYLDKLMSLQMPSGGFSWFTGMPENRYITLEIMQKIGRLIKITNNDFQQKYEDKFNLAINFLDIELAKDFNILKKNNKNYNTQNCIDNMQLYYLLMRSEFKNVPIPDVAKDAVEFYRSQSEKYRTDFSLYGQAMAAIIAHRNGKTDIAKSILKSLKENALKTDEFGMYWAKNKAGYFWNERPIAIQAAMIEAFTEISNNTSDIDEMKIWLLKQKQTQSWDTPTATVDAIYALINTGSNWIETKGKVTIKIAENIITPESSEAGTGYFKQIIPTENLNNKSGAITVKSESQEIGWGAMYWQYYQTPEKLANQNGPLKISKKLFVVKQSDTKKTIVPIEQVKVQKGDKIITRLVITTDRDLEFVALKDMRAACFEPVNQLSGCEWKENVCYYQTTKDASTQFFFSALAKGTYVFEYELWANNSGEFSSGIASIQCQYAPEFVGYAGAQRVSIEK